MSAFIFGAGYSGRAIAGALLRATDRVWGTTRSTDNMQRLDDLGVSPLLFDGDAIKPGRDKSLNTALRQTTHLIVSIAPDGSLMRDVFDRLLRNRDLRPVFLTE